MSDHAMKAVVLGDGELKFENNYQPKLSSSEVEVKVLQAGVCETDLQLVRGYMGFSGVLGHEFVGIAQTRKFAGQRVVGEINCACNDCSYCSKGLQNHCPQRTVIGILNHDGAFAESVSVPEKNLHGIPDNVTNDQAVFVEPLAAAFQIPAQIDLSSFNKIVLLGDGRLGNLCAQVISIDNTSLTVVGKHPEKLSRLQSLGIETALLSEFDEKQSADLVVDCTGSRNGMEAAIQIVKPRGTIVLKSTFAGQNGPNLAEIVIHEINLIGSRCGPFETAIQALAQKSIEVDSLITSRFSIDEAVAAFETAKQKDQLKVLLEID
ncbi:alcohol dehydrogenase catalytic domain-containing protein [bacterium]|jgi:threonine dehydrogenase-like Zn-dependent dehydrogenase|nr:alcohol dehydrogenase catalytic domain-containing protein [bacterium]